MLQYVTSSRSLVPLGIVVFGFIAGFLNVSGSIAAMMVGCMVVEAGWDVAGMLIAFFMIGSICTKFKQQEKEHAMPYPEEEEEAAKSNESQQQQQTKKKRKGRDMFQVCATGLIPAIICAYRNYFPLIPPPSSPSSPLLISVRPYWYLTYVAYLACCSGDTLASEIGMLSKQAPIMILQKKKVSKGVDGGMTLLGTFASVAGGALVGSFGGSWFDLFICSVYGCIGAFIDSILGTYMQSTQYLQSASPTAPASRANGHHKRDRDGFVDETISTAPLPLTPSKWKHLNNVVNMLSSILTAAIAITVQYLHLQYDYDLVPFLTYLCLLLLITVAPDMKPIVPVILNLLVAILCAAYLCPHLLASCAVPIWLSCLMYARWRMSK